MDTLDYSGRRCFLKTVGAVGAAVALPNSVDAAPDEIGLHARALKKGMFFGCSVSVPVLRADPRFRAAVLKDCGIVVPENELKWSRVQPAPDRSALNFTFADYIYKFVQQNGLQLRGHTLVWSSGVPAWAQRQMGDMKSATAAAGFLQMHVADVVRAWRGRVVHWDVVNEPVAEDAKSSIWLDKLGEAYIDMAFQVARENDPGALLVLNQNLVEMDDSYQGSLRKKLLLLLERLLKRGVPVDAVGIEAHLSGDLKVAVKEYTSLLREIERMGLKVIVTELDVWDGRMSGSVAERDKAAAQVVKDLLDISFSFKNCLGALAWTLTDLYSWYHETPKKWRQDGEINRPGLLDSNYSRKAMWNAVASAFDAAPVR